MKHEYYVTVPDWTFTEAEFYVQVHEDFFSNGNIVLVPKHEAELALLWADPSRDSWLLKAMSSYLKRGEVPTREAMVQAAAEMLVRAPEQVMVSESSTAAQRHSENPYAELPEDEVKAWKAYSEECAKERESIGGNDL